MQNIEYLHAKVQNKTKKQSTILQYDGLVHLLKELLVRQKHSLQQRMCPIAPPLKAAHIKT